MNDIEQALDQVDKDQPPRPWMPGTILAKAYIAEKARADALAKRLEAAEGVVDAVRVLGDCYCKSHGSPDYAVCSYECKQSLAAFDAQSSEGK